jgi:AcrR family transcriptional regulator
MPAALHSRDEVIARLMKVIRHNGYDGSSLAELSKATGLGKSSLYHYFPEGKDDMVRAVLDHLGAQLEATLFAPLRGEGSPARRIQAMVRTLDQFYRHGHESCVLAQLVLGSTRQRFGARLKAIFGAWVSALAGALVDAGIPKATARQRAEDAVLRTEGALVLSGGLGDMDVFARTLRHMPAMLLAPVPRARR